MLLGTPEGEVKVYDANGMPIHNIKMACLRGMVEPNMFARPNLPLASVCWYNNAKMHTDDTPAGLLIGFSKE